MKYGANDTYHSVNDLWRLGASSSLDCYKNQPTLALHKLYLSIGFHWLDNWLIVNFLLLHVKLFRQPEEAVKGSSFQWPIIIYANVLFDRLQDQGASVVLIRGFLKHSTHTVQKEDIFNFKLPLDSLVPDDKLSLQCIQ